MRRRRQERNGNERCGRSCGLREKRQVKQASQHGEEEMKRRRWVVRVRSGRLKMGHILAQRARKELPTVNSIVRGLVTDTSL